MAGSGRSNFVAVLPSLLRTYPPTDRKTWMFSGYSAPLRVLLLACRDTYLSLFGSVTSPVRVSDSPWPPQMPLRSGCPSGVMGVGLEASGLGFAGPPRPPRCADACWATMPIAPKQKTAAIAVV